MTVPASDDDPGRHLNIVRGEPTAEELAALVAVLSAAAARADAASAQLAASRRTVFRSLWARPSRNIRPPQAPSRDAWRASGFPR